MEISTPEELQQFKKTGHLNLRQDSLRWAINKSCRYCPDPKNGIKRPDAQLTFPLARVPKIRAAVSR